MPLPALDTTSAVSNSAERSFGSTIAHIAVLIGADHFPTGERAALKRMARDEPPGLAFYRFWPRYLNAEAPPEGRVREWAAILAGIALAARGRAPDG